MEGQGSQFADRDGGRLEDGSNKFVRRIECNFMVGGEVAFSVVTIIISVGNN